MPDWKAGKRLLSMTVCVLFLGCQNPVRPGAQRAAEGERTVQLDGEIVDLHCYFLDPAKNHGFDHAQCARRSIRMGSPAGFLSDGHLYLLLRTDDRSIRGDVFRLCGSTIQVVGTLLREGGMDAIRVQSLAGIAVTPHAEGR